MNVAPAPVASSGADARTLAGARRAAVAFVAAAAAGLALARFGLGGHGLLAAYVAGVLVVLAAIDLERRILPNRIVLPSAAVVLAARLALDPDRAPEFALASLGASLVLLLPLLAYPAGMGMGDVKLALLLGAALGKGVAVALPLGFFAAFPVALVILVSRGAGARKTVIPFGPFLALGALVVLFLGSP